MHRPALAFSSSRAEGAQCGAKCDYGWMAQKKFVLHGSAPPAWRGSFGINLRNSYKISYDQLLSSFHTLVLTTTERFFFWRWNLFGVVWVTAPHTASFILQGCFRRQVLRILFSSPLCGQVRYRVWTVFFDHLHEFDALCFVCFSFCTLADFCFPNHAHGSPFLRSGTAWDSLNNQIASWWTFLLSCLLLKCQTVSLSSSVLQHKPVRCHVSPVMSHPPLFLFICFMSLMAVVLHSDFWYVSLSRWSLSNVTRHSAIYLLGLCVKTALDKKVKVT